MFSIVLFGGCSKEWHEERMVNFSFDESISFNMGDGVLSQVDLRVEYKIIGDPNADTSAVNVWDCTYEERQGISTYNTTFNFFKYSPYKLMNYDHLEFKVTTSSIGNAFIGLPAVNLELDFKAETFFKNFEPDDRRITETLLTINSPDTTIYFTWSPPNFN
jgi:hypothetical protein